MRAKRFMMAAVFVGAMASDAHAEPPPSDHLRMKDASTLILKSGRTLDLSPGRYITEEKFSAFELETKRLQEAEIRLKAENESLRKSAEGWRPGWKILAGAVLTGIGVGVYVTVRVTE